MDDRFRKMLGTRIALARMAKNMTQDELSAAIGIDSITVSRYERGKSAPNAEKLVSIARTLDCTTDFLCGMTDTLTLKES